MALIDVLGLTKAYADGEVTTRVLRGVTFSIEAGEFVSIMGPSGSGKSTLLHILGFLDRPTDGVYRFDGRTIDEHSDIELARIRNRKMGFVFQTFNLLPRTSVLDNVLLPLFYSDVPERQWRSRAKEAIEAVGLAHRLEHESSELSGGERQRVAIARALVNNPAVVFADEPTGNLDSKSGEQVMDIIAELHSRGTTVILVTHETYTSRYADRVITLFDGKIESDAPVPAEERSRLEYFTK